MKPIFEITSNNGSNKKMAIYANGKIEGFPPDMTVVINRIAVEIDAAYRQGKRN